MPVIGIWTKNRSGIEIRTGSRSGAVTEIWTLDESETENRPGTGIETEFILKLEL